MMIVFHPIVCQIFFLVSEDYRETFHNLLVQYSPFQKDWAILRRYSDENSFAILKLKIPIREKKLIATQDGTLYTIHILKTKDSLPSPKTSIPIHAFTIIWDGKIQDIDEWMALFKQSLHVNSYGANKVICFDLIGDFPYQNDLPIIPIDEVNLDFIFDTVHSIVNTIA